MHGPRTPPVVRSNRLAVAVNWVASIFLVGVVSVVVIASLAALIFAGPLEAFLPIGLAGGLVGALVVNVAIAVLPRTGALVALPAASTAVILAIVMANLSATLAGAPDEVMAASAVMALAATTFVTGLLFLVAGVFRLGDLARYVPYPVFAGFLGGVGLLIVIGALDMAAQPAGGGVLVGGAVVYWLPALGLGAALLGARRLWPALAILPIGIIGAVVLFHIALAALGIGVEAASRAGLLLGGADTVVPAPLALFGTMHNADLQAVAGQWPSMAVLALIALIAATLGASGIGLSTRHDTSIGSDLRTMGLGNLLASLGGGLQAYHNVGVTVLLHRFIEGAPGRAGLGVALVLAAALAGGMEYLTLLPRVVCAAVLVYVGLDLIDTWVVEARRRMPAGDFAILLGIVVVGVSVGFLEAVAVGMAAAIGLFIFNYARLDFVRTALDGSLRQSTTERSEVDREVIIAAGSGVRIFELQGYVFFGGAEKLLQRLSVELSASPLRIRAIIVDFRHTQGIDVSAGVALAGLAKRCAARGVRLWFTNVDGRLEAMIRRMNTHADLRVAPNLDAALAAEEDEVLARTPTVHPASALAELMSRIDAAGHEGLFPRHHIAAGTVVYRQGEAADSLVLLEEGRMSARVITPEGMEVQVATILPGALIGEIGFFGGIARTASVVAETDGIMRVVRQADLEQLTRQAPDLGEEFLRSGASLMAHRLARTNALLRHTYR